MIHLGTAPLGHASIKTTGRYLHARPNDSSSRFLPLSPPPASAACPTDLLVTSRQPFDLLASMIEWRFQFYVANPEGRNCLSAGDVPVYHGC